MVFLTHASHSLGERDAMLLVGLLLLSKPHWFFVPPPKRLKETEKERERCMRLAKRRRARQRRTPKAKETNSVFSAPCALMSCATQNAATLNHGN